MAASISSWVALGARARTSWVAGSVTSISSRDWPACHWPSISWGIARGVAGLLLFLCGPCYSRPWRGCGLTILLIGWTILVFEQERERHERDGGNFQLAAARRRPALHRAAAAASRAGPPSLDQRLLPAGPGVLPGGRRAPYAACPAGGSPADLLPCRAWLAGDRGWTIRSGRRRSYAVAAGPRPRLRRR